MPHHDTHGFYSFELQSDFARIKENLIALEPGIDFDDWLPLRAEPEVETSPPTKVMERYLGKFVESAVQHVGWVPRDVYHFVVRPTSHGMFCTMLERYRC